MLNLWRHPKTQEIRLYFSRLAMQKALDATESDITTSQIRAWLELREGCPVAKLLPNKGVVADKRLLREIREHLEQEVALNASSDWDNLVASASTPRQSAPDSTDTSHNDYPGNTEEPAPQAEADDAQTAQRNRRRAAEASRLEVASIKMKHPITIEVDHRETRLISELISAHEKVTVKTVNLQLADFRVTDRAGNELLIERKRCTPEGNKTDFEASIQGDSRLFDQSERLKFQVSNSDHQVIPIILLEGNVHTNATSMQLKQIDGVLSFIAAVQRISVLQSYNANHSAYMIVKLAAHFIGGLYEVPSFHRAKPTALFEQKRYVLESLPNISTQIAESLLEHFGSIQSVANACEGELARVKGIGAKRSREIRRVLGELKDI